MTDDELTPQERDALASLPKEKAPSALLEERVVGSLRQHGLLGSREGHRFIRFTAWRIAGAIAACAVLVLSSFALGFRAGSRPAHVSQTPAPGSNGLHLALSVQQAGTDYILALDRLACCAVSTNSEEARQGREVALNTLYTAAGQMVKIVPRDVLAPCIVNAVATAENLKADPNDADPAPRTIEF